MSAKSEVSTGGVGFLSLLFLVLMTLKLTGHLDAAWLWISAPLWGPLALFLSVLLLVGVVAVALSLCDWVGSNCKRRGSGGRLR